MSMDGQDEGGSRWCVEVAHGVRLGTFAGTAPLKSIKIIFSKAASIKNKRGRHTRVLALYDISVAFWHAQLLHDEPLAKYPPRGEEKAGYMLQMKRAMCGTDVHRVSSKSTGGPRRSRLCSAQGMSPSILLP